MLVLVQSIAPRKGMARCQDCPANAARSQETQDCECLAGRLATRHAEQPDQ